MRVLNASTLSAALLVLGCHQGEVSDSPADADHTDESLAGRAYVCELNADLRIDGVPIVANDFTAFPVVNGGPTIMDAIELHRPGQPAVKTHFVIDIIETPDPDDPLLLVDVQLAPESNSAQGIRRGDGVSLSVGMTGPQSRVTLTGDLATDISDDGIDDCEPGAKGEQCRRFGTTVTCASRPGSE